jgi:hypothetical protein
MGIISMIKGKEFSFFRKQAVDGVHFDDGSSRVNFYIIEKMRMGMPEFKQRVLIAGPSRPIGFFGFERDGPH